MPAAKTAAREYHHGNLRQTILDTSLKLIEKKGIEALTLREIGRLAGVSRTAAYRHFADKDALLGAISAVGFAEFATALEHARDTAGPEFEPQLAAMAQAYLHFATERPSHYQVMFHWATEASKTGETVENPTSWHEPAEHSFKVLADVVARGQAQGKVRSGNPAELARVVWASVHGLALLPSGPDPVDDRRLLALFTQVLLQGLRPSSAG